MNWFSAAIYTLTVSTQNLWIACSDQRINDFFRFEYVQFSIKVTHEPRPQRWECASDPDRQIHALDAPRNWFWLQKWIVKSRVMLNLNYPLQRWMAQRIDIIGAVAVFAINIYFRSVQCSAGCHCFSDFNIFACRYLVMCASFHTTLENILMF